MKIAVVTEADDLVDAALAGLGHDVDVEQVPAAARGTAERLLDKWRLAPPDVVHARSAAAGVPALLAAHELGLPTVQSYGGIAVGGPGGDPERTRAERLTGREATHVIAVGTGQRADLLCLGVKRADVTVVPLAVDTDVFRPDGPTAPRDRRHRLVVVGEVRSDRGFQDVVTALRSLPEAELVVAAGDDGPDGRRLTTHAHVCGVEKRVRFEADPDLPALLRSADVVVCPARCEPDPTTALRAMACGVPVVAAATDVLVETVVDGVTGSLVPPRDTTSLARALRDLLPAKARREAYGTAAVDRVQVRHSVERVAAATEQVLEAVLSAVRGPKRQPSGKAVATTTSR
ncbi:glycosyltransferase [Actinosynnema sp. NPDC050436]|uniref:glycosyltransferase n=1 Tax=Actinosynnema sp. NPDC050436 TaxID=3155659 RepID=UPI0033CDA876